MHIYIHIYLYICMYRYIYIYVCLNCPFQDPGSKSPTRYGLLNQNPDMGSIWTLLGIECGVYKECTWVLSKRIFYLLKDYVDPLGCLPLSIDVASPMYANVPSFCPTQALRATTRPQAPLQSFTTCILIPRS